MAGREMEMGPTGDTVRENIQRLRRLRGLSYAELSRQLKDLGRPIAPLGLRRIEEGTRRVDVDDLMAVAVALWTSPATLLLPDVIGKEVAREYTALGTANTDDAREWVIGRALAPTATEDTLSARFRFREQSQARRIHPSRSGTGTWRIIGPDKQLQILWDLAGRGILNVVAPPNRETVQSLLEQLENDESWANAYRDAEVKSAMRAQLESARAVAIAEAKAFLTNSADA